MGRSAGFASPYYFAMEKLSPSPYINRFLSADTIVPGYANPQSLNRYSYGLNNPSRYTDPTGHSVDCALGEQYCEVGKLNVTKRANDLYRSIKHRDRQHNQTTYWQDLTGEERSILLESNWGEGSFNDNGGAPQADALHDPAVYISFAFGGWASGLFETSFWGAATACIGNPVCRTVTGVAGGTGVGAGTVPDLTPEKLEHVFGNSDHKLDPLLESFGGDQQAAFTATYRGFATAAGNYSQSELASGIPVNVGGVIVVVRGAIVNGVARIGTFFIP